MQVDWKKVEKDVNKAKKHLKKKANKAAPEINTFIEEVKVPVTKLALSFTLLLVFDDLILIIIVQLSLKLCYIHSALPTYLLHVID